MSSYGAFHFVEPETTHGKHTSVSKLKLVRMPFNIHQILKIHEQGSDASTVAVGDNALMRLIRAQNEAHVSSK